MSRATVLVVVVGLLITAAVTWTAWTLNRHSERSLLQVQTRQAGAVLAATILGISDPLTTGLQVAQATGGDPSTFNQYMAQHTGSGQLFSSASLWTTTDGVAHPIANVGAPVALPASSARAQALIERARHSATFVVASVRTGTRQHIVYALSDPADRRFVVYAERAIPANREVPVESNSAFSDLDYATYLGKTTRISALTTTDVPLNRLPLSGITSTAAIPLGDTTLTLVTTPRGQLGDQFGADLPWILLGGGLFLTCATALVVEQLVRRRRDAERDARTITGLYGQLDHLYDEQHSIAETLQRALLPQFNPEVPALEIATRYVAGASGVDVGGDWYSFISIDDDHFAFAVGDVSGRGLSAATIMARLRFTIRAYLFEGHSPDDVLEMCSRQLDIMEDGHLATILVGVGNLATREVTIASAGHPNPLIISASHWEYATAPVGIPLGIELATYESATFRVPPGATLLAFTDGLFERRDERIDVGLQRLGSRALAPSQTLDGLLTTLIGDLTDHDAEDDIAILAFRWHRVS